MHGDESLKPLETGNGVLKEVPDQSASKETHDAASAKDFLTMSWEGIVIPDGDLAGTFRSGVLYMKVERHAAVHMGVAHPLLQGLPSCHDRSRGYGQVAFRCARSSCANLFGLRSVLICMPR